MIFGKRSSIQKVTEMACCGCLGFTFMRNVKRIIGPRRHTGNNAYQNSLLHDDVEDELNDNFLEGNVTDTGNTFEYQSPANQVEGILMYRIQHGLLCREIPVMETRILVRSEDENGNKTVNDYIRERKIGAGSYGKVALYQNQSDGKYYAIKAFHKSHLLKLRVAPSQTAMTDVLREVLIMKVLSHPNLVSLIEVIDDPSMDNLYMVMEYVEGKFPGPGTGENTARKHLRDIVSGLVYLHTHNIVHGDVKPDNLLVTSSGTVKICDFGVSQIFEDENDVLSRSPGTTAFTAPECCLGRTYHGKAADTWAVGVTLYYMVLGKYPFMGETLQDTYERIVHHPLVLPDDMNPLLKDLLKGLLCKDPRERMTLKDIAQHAWVIEEEGPIPQYLCWCKSHSLPCPRDIQ